VYTEKQGGTQLPSARASAGPQQARLTAAHRRQSALNYARRWPLFCPHASRGGLLAPSRPFPLGCVLGVALLIAMAAYYQYSAKPAPETLMEDVEVSKEKPQAVQAVALHPAVVAAGGHVREEEFKSNRKEWAHSLRDIMTMAEKQEASQTLETALRADQVEQLSKTKAELSASEAKYAEQLEKEVAKLLQQKSEDVATALMMKSELAAAKKEVCSSDEQRNPCQSCRVSSSVLSA